jgi:hypothetical protein
MHGVHAKGESGAVLFIFSLVFIAVFLLRFIFKWNSPAEDEPQSVILQLVAAFFETIIIFCPPIWSYLWYKRHKKSKGEALKAAEDLLGQVKKARTELDVYIQLVFEMRDAYSESETEINENIPKIRLQIDKIKFTPKLAEHCEKIWDRAHIICLLSPVKRRRHFDTYHSMLMFSRLVALLKASKISGFMRSASLLQQYIQRRDKSTLKKGAIDTFAEDYLDESAYGINKTLTDEVKVFVDAQDVLDDLEADLEFVILKSRSIFDRSKP